MAVTGKDKCRLLREVRRQIAQANGIPFSSPDCPYTGPCAGTCPKCDEELCRLAQALEQRRAEGLPVRLTGLCREAFETGTARWRVTP